MTEFDRWRIARQEVDQLLQQIQDGPHGSHAGIEQVEPMAPEPRGALAHHAAVVRAAALRILRPGAR